MYLWLLLWRSLFSSNFSSIVYVCKVRQSIFTVILFIHFDACENLFCSHTRFVTWQHIITSWAQFIGCSQLWRWFLLRKYKSTFFYSYTHKHIHTYKIQKCFAWYFYIIRQNTHQYGIINYTLSIDVSISLICYSCFCRYTISSKLFFLDKNRWYSWNLIFFILISFNGFRMDFQ